MKRFLPVRELARDDRFTWLREGDRLRDPRVARQRERDEARGRAAAEDAAADNGSYRRTGSSFSPLDDDAPERSRSLMHGIFMGELQALEGAGRTCWDFDDDTAPLALKLDMARQCWDETRHCEISVKLAEWMGTELGEFAEGRGLYAAACNPDPALRLTAVNRGIEGLAIDVFSNMRTFAAKAGDPVLGYAEDWMLADEVTHVKMGSDWLRRLTDGDPERRERALEFQRLVDKMFSGAGRGDHEDLARQNKLLAGFTDEEIDESHEAMDDETRAEAGRRIIEGSRGVEPAAAG